jgi:hypothetical protein
MAGKFGLLNGLKSRASVLIKYPAMNALRGVPRPTVQGEEAQIEIARQIGIAGQLVARIGATEGKTLEHYLVHRVARAVPIPYPDAIRLEVKKHSGYFPTEDAALDRFVRLYLADIPAIDVYAAWTRYDRRLSRGAPVKVRLFDLDPFFTQNRWTLALAGKRVTIVSPFRDTILRQYERREALFATPTLPPFELAVVQAPQTNVGTDVTGQDWFALLAQLDGEVAASQADVVITGAGGYGFPLAARAAERGSAAVVLGGATQLLFGIAGQRWLNDPQYRAIMTGAWTRPAESERPRGFDNLEIAGGAYW